AFALRRSLFSAAERRDYEEVFIACQVSFVRFRVTAFLLATSSDHPLLAAIETSEHPSGLTLSFRQLPSLKL
ncbi:hypothetical protein LP085_03105, partial [Achromobacter sp. MY14]|uniref:hypothetical protein n=1 Tax=unclassified Achromobacter TaxID=2626865 RepID=UPI001E646759